MGTFSPHTVSSIFRLPLTHTHTHTHTHLVEWLRPVIFSAARVCCHTVPCHSTMAFFSHNTHKCTCMNAYALTHAGLCGVWMWVYACLSARCAFFFFLGGGGLMCSGFVCFPSQTLAWALPGSCHVHQLEFYWRDEALSALIVQFSSLMLE